MAQDQFTRSWIIEHSLEIIKRYEPGDLTLRALHYQLLSDGMTNTQQHYKRVVAAMEVARWDGRVAFDTFSDHDREVHGKTEYEETDLDTEVENAERAISTWMNYYFKNRWENQPYHPEVWIEKKALQGIFDKPCKALNVALAPCKGYPSLTFLYEASNRFQEVINAGKLPVILYFGDYDASGEDIPRSIYENFVKFGVEVDIRRIALTEAQVIEMKLPPAPTKATDSRAANWDGLGQVELDAVEIGLLRRMCTNAINDLFDNDLYEELLEIQKTERADYKLRIQQFVNDQSNAEDNEEDQ